MKTMPTTINLKITEDNISKGLRGVASACPVALALKKHFKCKNISYSEIYVGVTYDYVRVNHSYYDCDDNSLYNFVEDFDEGCSPKPQTITLIKSCE